MGDSMLETEAPAQSERAPPKKRRRIVVSCTECHRRKQKVLVPPASSYVVDFLSSCDRELPCANCRSRNRETFCSYDRSALSSNNNTGTRVPSSTRSSHASFSSTVSKISQPLSTVAATWGYGQTGPSTISFLKKIETAPSSSEDQSSLSALSPTCTSREDSFAAREKYKSLIRLLPAKVFIDKLVAMFLREFNWQYYFVDADIFLAQLQEWNDLPFSIFSTEGPRGISPDLRVFPAVLFQMIAAALLVLPDNEEEDFVTLKYAANMTFEDLARDYSASGEEIVGLFGKRGLSLTTVQAEFLRASFLKYTANVTESWHMVGIAIRDAQELGMHRDSLDPKTAETGLGPVLENQWLIERRRKMYMILAMWDINMSLILGRPGTVDWRHSFPSLPVDAAAPVDRSRSPIIPRNAENDPPTPLTRALWLHELCLPLRDIQDLEREGPYPKDFSRVDRLHQKIMSIHNSTPSMFRLRDPDTRWDSDPEVGVWIGGSRYYGHLVHGFSLMALHRPYLFHRKESRVEALRASLTMLDMQRSMFGGLSSTSWRNFMLFFGTFDAIVLIASIYILFPHDHSEHKHLSVQHIHWAVERFAAMQHRNPLARAAQGVLRVILGKFTRALGHSASPSKASQTLGSVRDMSDKTTASVSGKAGTNSAVSLPASSHARECTGQGGFEGEDVGNPGLDMPGETWLSPSEWGVAPDSLSNIMPLFATSDLIYNDLSAVQPGGGVMAAAAEEEEEEEEEEMGIGAGGVSQWQFGGDIADGTLWQVLNQFQPR
ncbi:hypothetical protein ED733_006702 [Metarhizium rileyi]|uniref:Transcription factor domain-containing protein n=1 Tax=Metarhizium rileyi (strain RCEF 4871) TaxID=1649241 RepID=A0A5C6GP31_METRR|nr:hypothetical protein ED733_006702 [Metarhizium rileyi]